MASQRVAIGIDLGTTYSCVAAYLNGKVEVIANDQGNRITPSYVAFTDTDRLIGDAAKEQIAQNPENTIFDVKRIIGRKFNDETVQDDIERWPFTVTEKGDKLVIVAEHEEQVKEFSPEQISAMVLGKMKEVAETFIGSPVTDAVITVPAYFDNSQRQATIDSGKIAGLNVLRIISEPTAAAFAYGIQKNVVDKKNVLIFDLGGGTFDVAILEMEKGNFKVIAKSGDTHLGGEDFDSRLVEHFTEEIKRKLKKDLSDKRAIQRLKKECEKAKRVLASSTKANIDIECLIDGEDYHASLTRGRFEQLCGDLFEKTLEIVETTLEDSGLDKDDLDEIVLVGGSTRIKKIQSLLEDFFEGRKMNMTINPDEAVAYGAAIHAAVLTGVIPAEDLQQSDVNPLSLGIETVGGRMSTIIDRNTKIPVKRVKQNYTTFKDNQKTMEIKVFQGEDGDTERNHLLGSFILTNIQKAPRAVPSIDITFTLDANGILNVSAVDRATKCEGHVTIRSNTGRLGARAMDRMIAEGRSLDTADRRRRDCDEARNSLESYCFSAKTAVQNRRKTAGRITDEERKEVLEACNAALEWMEENERATEQQLAEEKRQLVDVCQPVLSQLA